MPPRRGRSRKEPARDESTSIYLEMLADESRHSRRQDRPLKRRKVQPSNHGRHFESASEDESGHLSAAETPPRANPQVVFDDSASSDESEFEFEDVDLQAQEETVAASADIAGSGDITIQLGSQPKETPSKSRTQRRLPASRIEKQKRLEIHKIHICCLLAYVSIRNAWCNDPSLRDKLRTLLTKRNLIYLKPRSSDSQFQRSRSFTDGLQQVSEAFRLMYKIVERGTRRPNWTSTISHHEKASEDHVPLSVRKEEFIQAGEDLRGSRDTGAQLFCALLRSAGVDARLVCSLQVLSFNAVPPIASTSPKAKRTITQDELAQLASSEATERKRQPADIAERTSNDSAEIEPKPVRRFGQSTAHGIDLGKAPAAVVREKLLVESSFPVYWVEAFDDARQEWLPVDPLVTRTVSKPSKLEPPANDPLNSMTYVIAFEDDGTAKDVTRRYVKAYNAKTRRARVESVKGGEAWWKRTLKVFYGGQADRDQVENAYLANREAAEPMPRNVQDFKNHPRYALERHLRHNEIIDAVKEVGKVAVTKGATTTESIYRRQDVKSVKSAAKWYQQGRDIQAGEQPLRYAKPRRSRRQRTQSPQDSNSEEEQDAGTGLYAERQTVLYIPPPVVAGKVPRNAYGNLDVYVESMVPRGGVHVRAREALKAARLVGVDYAEAVTGFQFKGNKGTAIVTGVVIAKKYAAAVEEVVRGLRWLQQSDVAEKRSRLAVRMWKRFLTGLKVVQRVQEYADEDEAVGVDVRDEVEKLEEEEQNMRGQGGFVPDDDLAFGGAAVHRGVSPSFLDEAAAAAINSLDPFEISSTRLPPDYGDYEMSVYSPWDIEDQAAGPAPEIKVPATDATLKDITGGGGGFVSEESQPGGFVTEDENMGGGFIPEENSHDGGGFLPGDHEMAGLDGGFIHEEKDDEGELSMVDRNVLGHTSHNSEADMPMMDQSEQADDQEMRDAADSQLTEASQPLNPKTEEVELEKSTSPPAQGNTGNGGSDEDMDDATSLMSHDPEDEDAEPDWL